MNILAVIIIGFVILFVAVIVLFVLHFHRKPAMKASNVNKKLQSQLDNLSQTVENNSSSIENMATSITTDEINIGPWSIHSAGTGTNTELQFCGNNVPRMYLKNPFSVPTQLFVQDLQVPGCRSFEPECKIGSGQPNKKVKNKTVTGWKVLGKDSCGQYA